MRIPAFSVVVVSWKTRELTLACLASVEAERDRSEINVELLVVDNQSGDGTVEAIRSQFPTVNVLESGRNAGFAAACNLGLRHCSGEIVLFLNPDARLLPGGTLESFGRFFAEHSEAEVAGPLLVDVAGEPQFSCGRFLTATNQFAETLGLHRLMNVSALRRSYDRPSGSDPVPVDWITGACMAVRRATLQRLSGFDERFYMYSEDEDLCRRAAGHVYFLPSVRVVHEGGRAAAQDFPRMKAAARSSQAIYLRKHSGKVVEIAFRALMTLARLKPSRQKEKVGWGQ